MLKLVILDTLILAEVELVGYSNNSPKKYKHFT